MEKSETLLNVWNALKQEGWNKPGIYQRRVAAYSPHSLYAYRVFPGEVLGFFLEVSPDTAKHISDDASRGFLFSREWAADANKFRLKFSLPDVRFADLFCMMAQDIYSKVIAAGSEMDATKALLKRIEHWKKFLKNSGEDGLSLEKQTGLFGEVFLLNMLLSSCNIDPDKAIDSWKGPEGASQDFISGASAVEVKTTVSNDIFKVHISNEFQLESAGLARLLLCLHAFEIRSDAGQTLPDLVSETSELLGEMYSEKFTDLLALTGYHSVHENKYRSNSYTHRFSRLYDVQENFPRIIKSALPQEVSEVRYVVDITNIPLIKQSMCDSLNNIYCGGEF